MEAFRLLYAIHFVLGLLCALRLWVYIPAIFGPLWNLEVSARDVVTSASVSILALLWYFVWYGSIRFAISGEFPILPIRLFALLLAAVYTGTGLLAASMYGETFSQFIQNHSPLFAVIAIMVSLAGATASALPKLKRSWDLGKEREAREKDGRLDQMFRINKPRIRP